MAAKSRSTDLLKLVAVQALHAAAIRTTHRAAFAPEGRSAVRAKQMSARYKRHDAGLGLKAYRA